MTPTGQNYPNTIVDNADSFAVWSNPINAKLEDGSTATAQLWNGTTALAHTNYLKATSFNFVGIPNAAIITGVQVDVKRSGQLTTDYSVQLVKGGTISGIEHANMCSNVTTSTITWGTYGSSSDIWGLTLAPTDIMNGNFGVALAFGATHDPADMSVSVDAIRITVYYSVSALAVNAPLPKDYLYKVYNSGGTYLGMLPKPTNDFAYAWDINSGGSQITVEIPISIDTAFSQQVQSIQDETGAIIQDELGNPITTDGGTPFVGIGNGGDTLIKNGNKLVVWESGYYYPAGHIVFQGVMERWESTFGGDAQSESVKILAYSDGQSLTNHVPKGYGALVADQAQTNQNNYVTVTNPAYLSVGQTFTTGGVTTIGAVTLYIAAVSTPNNVTVHICLSPGGAEIGSTTLNIGSTTAAAFQFVFPVPIAVNRNYTYFLYVTASDASGINVYVNNAVSYTRGREYINTGHGWGIAGTQEMYFQIFSAPISTTVNYTGQDPSTGILKPIMDQYIAAGGPITYTSTSIDATGLALTYQSSSNTTYENIQSMLTLAPSGFYFYVDFGSNTLYFKRASTTADIVLTKGKHLNQITIVGTIEYVVNRVYMSGGQVSGVNIYTVDQDSASIAQYGVHLDRKSDNRITDATTAHAVGSSEIAEKKDEQYQTTVTVVDKTMDISLFRPGMIIGFNGFGTFVDNLIAQLVHIDYTPEQVTLQLGILPKRQANSIEKITKGLDALNTINNPSSPN